MLATALKTSNTVERQEEAAIIGEIYEELTRVVVMHTGFGGASMIDMLVGDPLSQIC
jgi:hydrogenase maturation factor